MEVDCGRQVCNSLTLLTIPNPGSPDFCIRNSKNIAPPRTGVGNLWRKLLIHYAHKYLAAPTRLFLLQEEQKHVSVSPPGTEAKQFASYTEKPRFL
jgi:hypothetical protein